jgi:hypothetical protein
MVGHRELDLRRWIAPLQLRQACAHPCQCRLCGVALAGGCPLPRRTASIFASLSRSCASIVIPPPERQAAWPQMSSIWFHSSGKMRNGFLKSLPRHPTMNVMLLA